MGEPPREPEWDPEEVVVDVNRFLTDSEPDERFRHLFELIGDPVVEIEMVDERPIVRTVNPAFESVFGYDREQVLGKSLNEVIVPEACSAEATHFDQRTAEGQYNSGVVTRVTSTGPREFLYRGVPYERGGRQYGFAIYTDITEQNQRKRELRRQKEQLEQFAEMLSHDVRNPLTVAQGRLELVEGEHVDVIRRSLERIEAITEDVLALARTGDPVTETETVSLATVVRRAWEQVDTRDATLSIEDDVRFEADQRRLQQILENLFQNSVEHGGDDVDIRIGSVPDGFYVADDGRGIPDTDQRSIFDRGYTTAPEGTGFGLSIVENAADAHGWDVSVTESRAGGAQFEIVGLSPVE